ncbi:MAG TPA: hypothetical protein VKR30_12380 [Candidatus Limnocylindrales bacterium]|nr:hypothetical protein [Candidatus Limnocylindrales bacterium]
MRPKLTRDRADRAALAARIAAIGGFVALIVVLLEIATGAPISWLGDLALIAMTLAIGPMMLGSYELGGVTPLWPSRLSLAGGIAGTVVWSMIQLAALAGIVPSNGGAPDSGVRLVADVALIVVGLWLTGAPPLAGPWLPSRLRWLGALSGLAFVLVGLGPIIGGDRTIGVIGGLGYVILFPIWAFLMARVFRTQAARAS